MTKIRTTQITNFTEDVETIVASSGWPAGVWSWTRTANVASTDKPFMGTTVAEDITPVGLSYDNSTGRFTFTWAGTYKIDCSVFLTANTSGERGIYLKKNGATIRTYDIYIHVSTDPSCWTFSIILDLAASDYITVELDIALPSIRRWCCMTIMQIA